MSYSCNKIWFYSSYTTFKYSDLSITPTTAKPGDNITVTVTVTNTGNMDGDEVRLWNTSRV